MLQKLDEAHINRLRVAEYLDTIDPDDFRMDECTKCICGHIHRQFLRQPILGRHPWETLMERAAKFLGIDIAEAHLLFCPKAMSSEIYSSPHDAARVMRYLAATDTVDWTVGVGRDGRERSYTFTYITREPLPAVPCSAAFPA